MSEIDWSKAPEWADRVVRGGTLNMNYWASDCMLQPVNNSCPPFKTNTHVRDNFQVVERRPTADTGIDWSKAPEWADRVVRGPRKRQLFWADDIQRQLIISGHQGVNNLHVRDNWEVVERRPVFVPGKPLVSFSWSCNAEPAPITIEQRIASLRALEKQVEETRAELTRDLEALGLMWLMQGEPTITDWRDLRVGDIVEHIKYNGGKVKIGAQGVVSGLKDWGIVVNYSDHQGHKYSCPENLYKFRFIRRP